MQVGALQSTCDNIEQRIKQCSVSEKDRLLVDTIKSFEEVYRPLYSLTHNYSIVLLLDVGFRGEKTRC